MLYLSAQGFRHSMQETFASLAVHYCVYWADGKIMHLRQIILSVGWINERYCDVWLTWTFWVTRPPI